MFVDPLLQTVLEEATNEELDVLSNFCLGNPRASELLPLLLEKQKRMLGEDPLN